MAAIHNAGPNNERMPVILTKEKAIEWLNEDLSDASIRDMLEAGYPASEMLAWPVHTIRTRKNDDDSVIAVMEGEFPPLEQ